MTQLTFEELKERLKRFDEIHLLEVLGITSGDLVEAFADIIEERFDKLLKEVDEDE